MNIRISKRKMKKAIALGLNKTFSADIGEGRFIYRNDSGKTIWIKVV